MPTSLETEALEFARELIRIDSVNTGERETIGTGEARAARLIEGWLADARITGEYLEPTPGRGSFVARIPGADRSAPALLAHAHLDVVPVEGQDWSHDPFGAEIRDGILYGRGAVDMKDYAGILVAVARHFARDGIVPRRDIVLAFVADEEAGGRWGAGWLVRKRPDLLSGVTESIGEVGGFSVPLPGRDGRDHRAYLLATAEKGVAAVTLTASGRGRHASLLSGDNAVIALAGAVAKLQEGRFPITLTPALEGFLARTRELTGLGFTAETLEDDIAGLGIAAPIIGASVRNTATPTVLRAGGKSNVVPAEASAHLDIRLLPGGDAAVRAGLRDLEDGAVSVREGHWWSASQAPVDSPLVGVIGEAVAGTDPDGTLVPFLSPASTDAKHFTRLGIANYGFTPLRVAADFDVFAQFHAADEGVPVAAIEFGARITADILRRA